MGISRQEAVSLLALLQECPQVGTFWTHYKGGRYQVIGRAIQEASLVPLVIYQDQEAGVVWSRPLAQWQGIVRVGEKDVPRFSPEIADSGTATGG